ncbi:MAG: hypothetical protein V4615_08130 [Bacteroidota bacterium]
MKTIMKKMIIAVVAVGFVALSSCNKNTCPTYSKSNVKHTEVRV